MAKDTPVSSQTSMLSLNPRGLASIIWLLAVRLLPLGLLVTLLLFLSYFVFGIDPTRVNSMRGLSVDYDIVFEQLDRSESVSANIGFLGDSSCLMGIKATALHADAQSYCTLAYVGPEGYAIMLNRMMEKGTAPKRLVLAFHPAQFRRDASWDSWSQLIRDAYAASENDSSPVLPQIDMNALRTALDFLRLNVLSRLFYDPLPGIYGQFYGGIWEFRRDIRTNRGSAVDPGNLQYLTLEEANVSPPKSEPTDYSLNEPFREALGHLAASISLYGIERVYFLISPVPDSIYDPDQSGKLRIAAATEIMAVLNIADDHFLPSPPFYPDGYFSSITHLSRVGRTAFTQDIDEILLKRGFGSNN